MSLNDSKIRKLKPSAKSFKVSDSHGLYLLVNPGGSRLWYLKYRINRKESSLSLSAYPDVSLADARQQRDGNRADVYPYQLDLPKFGCVCFRYYEQASNDQV
nr:Arm DNA-binding domain-containing protein [Pectobacterium parmentieri]